MRQVIFRFFSSGLDGNHSGALRRMITVKAFLLIMASICFVAIFLNLLLTFSLAIAVLDAIAFLITVIVLIDLHK
jgi:ABC-type multidrug transport system permease subunit